MQRQSSLNGYLHFEAVARCGSLSRAAEELSVSPSAVSQQIKLFEQSMGVALFRRTGRALVLTHDGEQLFQTASAALRMLRNARSDIVRPSETRRLSLRISPALGQIWLGSRLPGFIGAAPEQKLRLAAGGLSDFDEDGIDIEIRYGIGEWPNLLVQPLMRDTILPLAAPEFLRKLDPHDPLESAPLIDSAWNLVQWDGWFAHCGLKHLRTGRKLVVDNSTMVLDMAANGIGVALESLALAAPLIHAGRLVPLCPDKPALSFPAYWLVCPQGHTSFDAVRAFSNWVRDEAAAQESVDRGILARHGIDMMIWDPREVRTYGPASEL